MIQLKQGDILTADVEALVNTVNCVGVMGRGIALQFRKAFPENFTEYKAACDREALQPGKLLTHSLGRLTRPCYIVNFPTKKHWRGKSRIEYIEAGLAALVEEIRRLNIRSIAIPPLGCGLGGLRWETVRQRIEQAVGDLPDVDVWLFEPGGAPPAHAMPRHSSTPRMTIGRAALLGLMERYLVGLMEPFITLLEIHKLMYFMQEAGEPLKLRYVKALYGPYAENLRHVLNRIEGHFIIGYGDAEDDPKKRIDLKPEAVKKAWTFLDEHPETRRRFHRVDDLISGFETPFGMELMSSVHWVATREEAGDPATVLQRFHAWNKRKQRFQERQIRIAWEALHKKGWLKL